MLPSQVVTPERYYVQGQRATSIEARVARALDKLKHEYIFQFQLNGGRTRRGGIVIDFFVLTTIPFSTPVEVNGTYWHTGQLGADDRLKLAEIARILAGRANEAVILWEPDLLDQETADLSVKRELGGR